MAMTIEIARSRYEELLKPIMEIAKKINDYTALLNTQFILPIPLPYMKFSSEMVDQFLISLNERLKQLSGGTITIINNKLQKITAELYSVSPNTDSYMAPNHWYSVQVLSINIYGLIEENGKEQLEKIIIPIACNDSNCQIKMPLKEIIAMLFFMQENGHLVEKLKNILSEIDQEYTMIVEKLYKIANALKLAGFETDNSS